MGIHDRDYYRDDSRSWNPGDLRAVTLLIAVTVGIFVVQLFSAPGQGLPDPLLRYGAFSYPAILDGEVWRLVTSYFVHTYRLISIIFGMLALYWFGTELEDWYGMRRFLRFYLMAGLFVSGGKMALGALGLDPEKATAGASGPIFAVMTLYAFRFPARQVNFMMLIPVQVGVLVAILIGIYVLMFASGGGSKMEVAAPLLGAAFGAAYYALGNSWSFPRLTTGRSRSAERTRPTLTLHPVDLPSDDELFNSGAPTKTRSPRADEYLEAKLDAVLEKMARSGRESLTEEENAVLLRASEIYRQKGK